MRHIAALPMARALISAGIFAVMMAAAAPALADSGTAQLKVCTAKTPAGTPCVPFFGGALNIGDPAVSDSIQGAPCNVAGCGTTNVAEVINYSATGDGNVWMVNFSYTPGDPVSDTAIGVLIYDDRWNVVQLQNPVSDPPHTVSFPFETKNGTVYQVQ